MGFLRPLPNGRRLGAGRKRYCLDMFQWHFSDFWNCLCWNLEFGAWKFRYVLLTTASIRDFSLVLRWLEGHAGELDRSKRETLEVFEPSVEAAPFHSRWVFLFCDDNRGSLDFDVDLWWNCAVTRWICHLFGGGGRGSSDRSPVLCPWPVLHTATAWRTWRQWKTTLWRSKN